MLPDGGLKAEVHRDTGVAFGEASGYIGRMLGEIFVGCDQQRLPPLTSIVVRQEEREQRMPGPGYFRALAASENRAGRRLDAGVERWANTRLVANFDPDINRWEYAERVQAHQESVWRHVRWPGTV